MNQNAMEIDTISEWAAQVVSSGIERKKQEIAKLQKEIDEAEQALNKYSIEKGNKVIRNARGQKF